MAIPTMRVNYVVGDYLFGKQIGVGSFSTVWHATHRVNGTEVAIKEIVTARLNAKLRESLKSEIFILKKINHPNIIRLHDVIEKSGMIYIVLEYCRGGDLSMYIQQHQGRIPEATAQHFMQQLAEGLKVLRDNNLIHRDLKPQNLLLTTKDDESSVLKIADFGFARSLQPRGLAETLCGSPLYMAPEIMQLQKYDAKADLWSIGTILFQLVTGKTPFTGSNQMQLLQNIMKSNVLRFPPEAKKLSPHCIDLCVKLLRFNPVERLTFEEFFNHSYISQSRLYESFRNPEEPFQEDHFLCNVDGKFEGRDESPSSLRRSTLGIKSGFSLDVKSSRRDTSDSANRAGSFKYSSVTHEATGSVVLKESGLVSAVEDSLESIVRGYVMVPGPPFDLSSSSCTSKSIDSSYKSGHPSRDSAHMSTKISAIVPLSDELSGGVGSTRRTESRFSSPETFQASTCIVDTSQPSTDSISQINSLQLVATAMAALVNDKIKGRKQLEAFSIQLVVLATWKQALHICDSCMESSVEGSSSQQTSSDAQECFTRVQAPPNISSHIEAAFLHEVERAEELGKVIVPGNEEMPDAMELIYQYALSFGKRGAVDEYMGDMENADTFYSKAVQLLLFILEQAPRLVMNPPFSLTNSDQDRIRTYVNLLINRQSLSQSQRMISMKSDNRSQPG